MTLSATIDWEVDAAVGSDSAAGGGFNRSASGTDKTYGGSQAATSWTDLKVDATTNTKVKSNGGSPRALDATDIGNVIRITAGTGWTTGFYEVTAGPDGNGFMTLDRSPAATSTTGGSGSLGGALLTVGQAGAAHVAKNRIFLKYNASVYSVTSASSNVAGGCLSLAAGTSANLTSLIGYHTTRGDLDGTRPTLQASGISSFTLVNNANNAVYVANVILDANSLTSGKAVNVSANSVVFFCKIANCAGTPTNGGTGTIFLACEATGCSSIPFSGGGGLYAYCTAQSNSITGFNPPSGSECVGCLSINNTGASTFGFTVGQGARALHCVAYANGGATGGGFSSGSGGVLANCIAEGHTTAGAMGFGSPSSGDTGSLLINCAAYNNDTNFNTNFNSFLKIGCITLTGSPFTSASGGDFSLNNTANAGASCRAAGYPTKPPGVSTTTLSLSIGMAQDPNTTAGGGANLLGNGTLVAAA